MNDDKSADATPATGDASARQARRFFLKAGLYVAPAIATVVFVDKAHAQTGSCNPNEMCAPMTMACNPLDMT